jgi:hypothetical protein
MTSRPVLLLVLVSSVGCTRVLTAPDRAGCTLERTVTDASSGELLWTDERVLDAEGRQVERTLDWPGNYVYRERATYDAAGCQTEYVERYRYPNDDVQAQTTTRECDDNDDPVWQLYVQERDDRVAWEQETTYDRTYGDNGLTAVSEETTDFNGFYELETVVEYTYDRKDRVVRVLRSANGGTTLRTVRWYDELPTDDLRAAEEERDLTGFLSDATYSTYDERGRTTERRRLFRGTERVTRTTWTDDRYAPLEEAETRGDQLHRVDRHSYEDDFHVQRTEIDRYDADGADAADGVVDHLEVSIWTCP